MLKAGDKAPEFCLKDDAGREVCLSDFRGKWLVLYFYPKDNTPGCTREALEFTELIGEFEKLNAAVVGVSKDSPESHRRFREKHGLKVILLSDPEHKVIQQYGAWGRKRVAGREAEGTIRSTFLIDPEGIIRKTWTNVKVDGHAREVLEELRRLASNPG